MKLINRMSLRLRLTVLMGLILTVSCAVFMIASTKSAEDVYKDQPNDNNPNVIVFIGQRHQQNKEFAGKSFAISIIIIILGTCASYLVAKKAISPVSALSRHIKKIDENNLTLRIAVPDSNDEIADLAKSFNNMIIKLEKAFLAQKNFSSNAAHELKTPIAAMIAGIEVCQIDEQPTPEEYMQTLNDVLQNAERLNVLVNDLLLMMNNSAISATEVDIRELFNQIINELAPESKRTLNIENNIKSITVSGDKFLLNRAFLNIVHNAIKYNKPGGNITINAKTDNSITEIIVTDTGIGIPYEQYDKIFEPFYCVDQSRSRESGGSGLGLCIVKSIIEKHNGTIYVKSEPGVWTTFVVKLPK